MTSLHRLSTKAALTRTALTTTRLTTVALAVAATLCALTPALAGNGPWLVVAGSGDSIVTAIDISDGTIAGQQKIGSQAIGVAAISRRLAVADFLGGTLNVFSGQDIGNFVGGQKQKLVTSPDLPLPEGITVAGRGNWIFVTDGVTQVADQHVALQLWDIGTSKKLSQVVLPSAYGVAFSSLTGVAYALDGFSNQIAVIRVAGNGAMTDTGVRIPLTGGPATGSRFVALDEVHHRLLVSFKTQGVVEVIDLTTGTTAGLISDLGTKIGAIAITPDGSRAFVADYGGSKWEVLDLTVDGVPTHLTSVYSPYGVPNTFAGTKTWAFADDEMFYSATDANGVASINWQTLQLTDIEWTATNAPAGMDLAR